MSTIRQSSGSYKQDYLLEVMYAVCKIARDFKTVTVGKQRIVKNWVEHLCRRFNPNRLAEKDEEVADLLMGKSENHGFQWKNAEGSFQSE